MGLKKLIAGNWKMNGLKDESISLVKELSKRMTTNTNANFDMLICPPATLIALVAETLKNTPLMVGAQDCHTKDKGAFTGDISAPMLKDSGCQYVILGHSERRHGHGEPSTLISAKAMAANLAGLTAIICVGELEAERASGKEYEVVENQLKLSIPANSNANSIVVAYEPVWAIGTGKTATKDDVIKMHKFIRESLKDKVGNYKEVKILYGGSVKADNAKDILSIENVDGVLVGGASLKADDFWAIAQSA